MRMGYLFTFLILSIHLSETVVIVRVDNYSVHTIDSVPYDMLTTTGNFLWAYVHNFLLLSLLVVIDEYLMGHVNALRVLIHALDRCYTHTHKSDLASGFFLI